MKKGQINLKKGILLLFLCTCIIQEVSAQVYEAKYRMIYTGRIGTPIYSFNATSIVDLKVICNRYFMDVTGNLEKTLYIPNNPTQNLNTSKLKGDVEMSHVIIDIKKKLAWYPKEKEMYRIKGNKLLAAPVLKNEMCNKLSVLVRHKSIKVISCKNLPEFLSPAIIFFNQKYGINKIVAPNLKITLIGSPKKIDKTLDYEKLFDKKTLKISGTYFFFQNVN